MTEVFLHGLHVIAVLQGEHGEGVAQIMHTASGAPALAAIFL